MGTNLASFLVLLRDQILRPSPFTWVDLNEDSLFSVLSQMCRYVRY